MNVKFGEKQVRLLPHEYKRSRYLQSKQNEVQASERIYTMLGKGQHTLLRETIPSEMWDVLEQKGIDHETLRAICKRIDSDFLTTLQATRPDFVSLEKQYDALFVDVVHDIAFCKNQNVNEVIIAFLTLQHEPEITTPLSSTLQEFLARIPYSKSKTEKEQKQKEDAFVYEIIKHASWLQIDALSELMAFRVADMLEGMTSKQIHETFQIPRAFEPAVVEKLEEANWQETMDFANACFQQQKK